MAEERATAIVIRTVDFSESSLIVHLFSREHGKIQGIAKGARRLKSSFSNALDLLARIRVVLLHKTNDALDILTEASIEKRFRPAKGNLASLYAGYYIAELLGAMTDEWQPLPELYDATARLLDRLALPEAKVSLLLARYELDLLDILGYRPSLTDCVDCGKPVPPTGKIPFGFLDGGVVCSNCRAGKQMLTIVEAEVLHMGEGLSQVKETAVEATAVEPQRLKRLRTLLGQYICHNIGKKLKTIDLVQ